MCKIAKQENTVAAKEFLQQVDHAHFQYLKKMMEKTWAGDPDKLAIIQGATTQQELYAIQLSD